MNLKVRRHFHVIFQSKLLSLRPSLKEENNSVFLEHFGASPRHTILTIFLSSAINISSFSFQFHLQKILPNYAHFLMKLCTLFSLNICHLQFIFHHHSLILDLQKIMPKYTYFLLWETKPSYSTEILIFINSIPIQIVRVSESFLRI